MLKKDETRRVPDDIGEPEENRFKFEIRKCDGMHAFGAYVSGSAKEGKAIILIDGEMVFGEGELLADGEPYDPSNATRKTILIETLMHEFGHALEELLDTEFDEDFIEKCVESYREKGGVMNEFGSKTTTFRSWLYNELYGHFDFSVPVERQSGRTTRLADKSIQELFTTGRTTFKDHHGTVDQDQRLGDIVRKRIVAEHPHVVDMLNMRKDEIVFKKLDRR